MIIDLGLLTRSIRIATNFSSGDSKLITYTHMHAHTRTLTDENVLFYLFIVQCGFHSFKCGLAGVRSFRALGGEIVLRAYCL